MLLGTKFEANPNKNNQQQQQQQMSVASTADKEDNDPNLKEQRNHTESVDNEEPNLKENTDHAESVGSSKKSLVDRRRSRGHLGNYNGRDLKKYLPLYKAALQGDWRRAKELFDVDPEAMAEGITISSETALHVAAGAGHSLFVEELVKVMPPEALELQETSTGETALHVAAIAGITKAAKAMVSRNPNLTQIRDQDGWTPLLSAANYASDEQKEMVEYLCTVTRDDDPSPFSGDLGAELICTVIEADFYDIALFLLQRYPNLATDKNEDGDGALNVLAERKHAFLSGSRLSFWESCIYRVTPIDLASRRHSIVIEQDMEDPPENSGDHLSARVFQWMNGLLWEGIKHIVPGIKKVVNKKLMHKQAMDLVKIICAQISEKSSSEISEIYSDILIVAAASGTIELLLECMQIFPDLIWLQTEDDQTIFDIAIEERREKIFNLIYGMNVNKKKLAFLNDKSGNTVLHLAAKLAPAPQLSSVSGVALQMQRELQWFKEVENILLQTARVLQNNDGKTAQVLFTEEHKELVEKGEKWMKDTAQSCMVVATLIATVVFAAAFTVPGGNISCNDCTSSKNGVPVFLHKTPFMVFAITDALALFSSITSVLMFLSILTSRYAEEDFLTSLPTKLIIGLATLFFSIATMMVAFSATLFLVLGHGSSWLPIALALISCVPVTLFAFLQFPLLVQMIRSTYGPSIFHRKSNLKLY